MRNKFFSAGVRTVFLCVLFMLLSTPLADSGISFDGEILRLHVVANSDSEDDQALKLKVRDAVLKAAKELDFTAASARGAEKLLRENSELLESTANEVILNSGFSYAASTDFGVYHFPLKSYGSVTLPEGNYNALKIVLGKGEGHNWWCVMYPPLCLLNETAEFDEKSLDVLSAETKEKITEKPDIKVKFKIKEIIKNHKRKENI